MSERPRPVDCAACGIVAGPIGDDETCPACGNDAWPAERRIEQQRVEHDPRRVGRYELRKADRRGAAPPASVPEVERDDLLARFNALVAFLDGSADLEGAWYGEAAPKQYQMGDFLTVYWWRSHHLRPIADEIRAALSREQAVTPRVPVVPDSAGEVEVMPRGLGSVEVSGERPNRAAKAGADDTDASAGPNIGPCPFALPVRVERCTNLWRIVDADRQLLASYLPRATANWIANAINATGSTPRGDE